MNQYEEKKACLTEIIEGQVQHGVVLAFSGGVDSSLLLKLCCEAKKKKLMPGKGIYAVTFQTTMHPLGDLETAAQVAKEAGAIHEVLYVDEFSEAGIGNNPKDRCYLCKKYLFSRLLDFSSEHNIPVIMEGTNADDLTQYRPGIRAIKELAIKSPLLEAGFCKAEVREMARELKLSTADRPSAPCLATRFPYGTKLTQEKMKMVEQAELLLRAYDLYNVRLRVHGEIARLEIDLESMGVILENREKIVLDLKALGFLYVTLDLEGFRTGSMDVGVAK